MRTKGISTFIIRSETCTDLQVQQIMKLSIYEEFRSTRLNCSSACTVLFQLIEGTNSHQKECLGIMTPDYYYYLNQSGTYKVDGTNDNKDFQETMVRICF